MRRVQCKLPAAQDEGSLFSWSVFESWIAPLKNIENIIKEEFLANWYKDLKTCKMNYIIDISIVKMKCFEIL